MSSLVFLGTGVSGGVPRVSCLTQEKIRCSVCKSGADPSSKNHRRNTSVLIRWASPTAPPCNALGQSASSLNDDAPDGDGSMDSPPVRATNILIDCGKSFRASALHVLAPRKIRYIDACVITHAHADAFLGLDDLRDWTAFLEEKYDLPVWVRERDMPMVAQTFPYLVEKKEATGSGFVGTLCFSTFSPPSTFEVLGLKITPLEVMHGKTYTCCGFLIGSMAYLSDCCGIPEDVMGKLRKTEAFQLDVLILDTIAQDGEYSSHFTLEQSIDAIRSIRPKVTYLTGLSHHIDYHCWTAMLSEYDAREGLDVRLSYDGLEIPISL